MADTSSNPLAVAALPPLVAKGNQDANMKTVVFKDSLTTQILRDAPDHFRFLVLPAEIRNMIYEMIVVVGRVHYCHNKARAGAGFELSQLALLISCKKIHAEAEPLFLSENVFHLPHWFHNYNPFSNRQHIGLYPRHLFSKAGLLHIRNIAIVFTTSHGIGQDPSDIWATSDLINGPGKWENMSASERPIFALEEQHTYTYDNFQEDQKHLRMFKRKMDYVEIDFTNTFCSIGCCRPISQCMGMWVVRLAPTTLNVIGLRVGEEQDISFHVNHGGAEVRRYNVEDLKELYSFRVLKTGDKTKWDA